MRRMSSGITCRKSRESCPGLRVALLGRPRALDLAANVGRRDAGPSCRFKLRYLFFLPLGHCTSGRNACLEENGSKTNRSCGEQLDRLALHGPAPQMKCHARAGLNFVWGPWANGRVGRIVDAGASGSSIRGVSFAANVV